MSTTGSEDTPSKVGISAADIAAGMYSYSGILTALYRRERTAKGATLDVSLFDALGEWMGYPAYFTAYGGKPPARTGARHATIAPYGPFRTGDGKWVNLGIQNEREWARFCETVLQRPTLASDARFNNNANRVEHGDALTAAIHEVFEQLTRADIVARLDQAQIANAAMNTLHDFWDHPQLAARDRWREIDSPAGRLKGLLPPVIMNDAEVRMDAIPALGEHSEAILRSLGYGDTQIARLRAESVI